MKLFNVENGKEKVYVQYQDLMHLMHELDGMSVPASLFDKLFGDGRPLIVDDRNRWEFVEFTSPEDVQFFREQEWIIDFKEVRSLSFEGLIEHGTEVAKEHDEIALRLRELPREELEGHVDEINKMHGLEYKFHMLPECGFVNKGHKNMPFPTVPDSDGYVCASNEEYEAISSLDPNKIIIRRKDGQKLNKGKVGLRFIKEAIANGNVQMSEARATYCTVGNAKYALSEDGMYIVLTYKVQPILSKEEKEYKQNNTWVKRMQRKLTGKPEFTE